MKEFNIQAASFDSCRAHINTRTPERVRKLVAKMVRRARWRCEYYTANGMMDEAHVAWEMAKDIIAFFKERVPRDHKEIRLEMRRRKRLERRSLF